MYEYYGCANIAGISLFLSIVQIHHTDVLISNNNNELKDTHGP